PTVGLMPTNPFTEEGDTTDPSVSVPIATVQRLAEAADPEPALEPEGFRSRIYGHRVWRPRLLQPLVLRVDRKLAHSLRLVLPRTIAPAFRSWVMINASCAALFPTRASEPA